MDGTGFPKKGARRAGVQNQYAGTAGRTENCRVGIFLACPAEHGRTLIGRRLYLPIFWTDDRKHRRRAGSTDETTFALHGFSKGRLHEPEQADVFHLMTTTRHDTVVTSWALDHPVHGLFPALPRQKWKRRSCGKGAHGPWATGL